MVSLVVHVATAFILAIGLSYLFQAEQWVRFTRDALQSPHLLIPLSLLMVVVGSAIVAVHNQWSLSWRVVITIFGWGILLKGVGLLVAPGIMKPMARWTDTTYIRLIRIGGIVATVLGAIVFYRVWFM